jgi:hypothetical protein
MQNCRRPPGDSSAASAVLVRRIDDQPQPVWFNPFSERP